MAKMFRKQTEQMFKLTAPSANSVLLAGDFTEWEKHPIRMEKESNGQWTARVPLKPGTHYYRFLVDGRWTDDPTCTQRVPNPYGSQNCVCQVSSGEGSKGKADAPRAIGEDARLHVAKQQKRSSLRM